MKLSKIFHVLSVVAGLAGLATLVGAWLANQNGTMMGFSEIHLFNDTVALLLVAIWLQLATMHHMMLEKKGETI